MANLLSFLLILPRVWPPPRPQLPRPQLPRVWLGARFKRALMPRRLPQAVTIREAASACSRTPCPQPACGPHPLPYCLSRTPLWNHTKASRTLMMDRSS